MPPTIKNSHPLDSVITDNIAYKLRGGPITTSESSRQLSRIINSFSESNSYLYELIQNADDACTSDDLRICINRSNNTIIFAHSAEPFSAPDINSICSTGIERTDPGSKSQDVSKIGYKGVGFKSVFKISDYVKIFSGDFSFEFNRSYWEQEGEDIAKGYGWEEDALVEWVEHCDKYHQKKTIEFPWQTLPIICNKKKPDGYDDYSVVVVIGLTNNFSDLLDKEISKIRSSADYLLFLNTSNILIDIEGETQKKEKENDQIKLSSMDSNEQWNIYSFSLLVDKSKLPRDFPPKMLEINKLSVSIAVRLNSKGEFLSLTENQVDIYSFLPTSEVYNLPFIINAQFALDNARERLDKDVEWNEALFDGAGILIANTVESLCADDSAIENAVKIIPENCFVSNYRERLVESTIESLKDKSFLPILGGQTLRKPNEVIIDKTGLSREEDLFMLIRLLLGDKDDKYIVDSSRLKGINRLESFDIPTLNIRDLKDCFRINEVIEFFKDQEESFFALLLKTFMESSVDIEMIKQIPFLKTTNEQLVCPVELFLNNDSSNELYDELSLDILSPGIYKNCNFFLKNWITNELCINIPDPESIVERSDRLDWHNKSTNLNIVRFLFSKKDFIRNWDKLRDISLITSNGNIEPIGELYLSDKYKPDIQIEKYFPEDDIFVSHDYCEEGDKPEEWGAFFKDKLKVCYCISIDNYTIREQSFFQSWKKFYSKSSLKGQLLTNYVEYSNKIFDENSKEINPNLTTRGDYKTKEYLFGVKYIRFLDKLGDCGTGFLAEFWKAVFDEISKVDLKSNDTIFSQENSPKYDWYEKAEYHGVYRLKNINIWAIQDAEIFPCSLTKEKKKAIELLYPNSTNNRLKDILPVLDIPIPEELSDVEIEGDKLLRFRNNPSESEIHQAIRKVKSEKGIELDEKRQIISLLYLMIIDLNDFTIGNSDLLLSEGGNFLQRKEILYIKNPSLRKRINSLIHLYIPQEFDYATEVKLVDLLSIESADIEIVGGKKDEEFLEFLKSKGDLLDILFSQNPAKGVMDHFPSFDVAMHPHMKISVQDEILSLGAHFDKVKGVLNVIENWRSKRRVQKEISEVLADYLDVEVLSIDDILWRSNTDLIEEWEEDGIAIPDGTKSYYFSLSLNEYSEEKNIVFKTPNDDYGMLSEKKVFNELIKSIVNLDPPSSSTIHDKYQYEKGDFRVEWKRGMDKSADFDILLEERVKGEKTSKFIEVKSIMNSQFDRNGESLYLSDPEWKRLYSTMNGSDEYYLAIVFNNRSSTLSKGDLKIVKMEPETDIKNLINRMKSSENS